MLDKRSFFALTLITLSSSSMAAALAPTGYSYITAPTTSGPYTYLDSGNELLDGFIMTNGWGNSVMTVDNAGPYVGWNTSNPQITFYFSNTVNLDSLTLFADDANGVAGVFIPNSVDISMGGVTLSNLAITNPPEANPVALNFSNLGLSGTSLTLNVVGSGQWTMLSEVQFFGTSTVPIPSTIYLILAGSIGWWRTRTHP